MKKRFGETAEQRDSASSPGRIRDDESYLPVETPCVPRSLQNSRSFSRPEASANRAGLSRDREPCNNVKVLKGRQAGSYRYRIGDVYTINDQSVTVLVITIANRSDVYE